MIKFTLNGKPREVDVEPDMPLLWVIRDVLDMKGTKFGCGIAQCGACTVHINGDPVRSCSYPVSAAEGQQVTTIEGIANKGKPHPVQAAFIEEQAAQCGYCINGMIMTSKALLDRNPDPTEPEIRKALETVLCRCGTHESIIRAVRRAAREMKP